MPKVAAPGKNLQDLNPSLAEAWHPIKNGQLTAKDVLPGSQKKAWWLCKKGHEWETSIRDRNNGHGCPYCSGQATCSDNCLATINRSLASEWHPNKNGSLTPQDVAPNSNKKAWWKCKRGHEWESNINDRNRGKGCPYCRSHISQLQLAIYCELKYLFDDAQLQKKVYGKECDVYIPRLLLGIEVDGLYWHKNKWEKDKEKYHFLKERGIELLRVRENGLKQIVPTDVFFSDKEDNLVVCQRIVKTIVHQSDNSILPNQDTNSYLERKTLANEDEFKRLSDLLPSPLPEFSLLTINPTLANEWHSQKNGSMTPLDVEPYSNRKVWWICEKGHEWKVSVDSRSGGSGCPYCSGRLACNDNCLDTLNPLLASEWHPKLNGNLTPKDVTPNSNKKVWWQCKKGHEWNTKVASRNDGCGCPSCSGRISTAENCLLTVSPSLTREWHPTRNGNLTPKDVTPSSGKKVWWTCAKGHEYKATINKKKQGQGCPFCTGKIAYEGNCLSVNNPSLSLEWHPAKNGNLTPKDVTPMSGRKVWWKCKNGHVWQAAISSRNNGRGCPQCSGRVATLEHCLLSANPALASEWHPIKNENLNPQDVAPQSNKKVWWICKKGHEWQASISNRSKSRGCPYCVGKAVGTDNCLLTINPLLAAQWHTTKNGSLTPKLVTAGSHKKVWWQCKRGHEWEATITNRSGLKRGCPYCAGQRK